VRRRADIGCRRLATLGGGRWHAREPEGTLTYLESYFDEITFGAVAVEERAGALKGVVARRLPRRR